ncbi:NIPSNAP family protein [Ideonella sp. YS5]|uniref:NIPSNAP family protein n=1 Tax=Ideonella sp. YS5 TaxID=3453714 RepID=UPI003EE8E7F3
MAQRLVEIRSYKLKAGEAAAFHEAVESTVMPMLRPAMDVVAYGPSAHEPDTYFLIRAYADLADLEATQAAFYGSNAWRQGPRKTIVERIESHLNTVLWMSQASVDDLRRSNPTLA